MGKLLRLAPARAVARVGGFARRPSRRAAGWLVGVAVVGDVALALWWTGTWGLLWEVFSDRERLQRTVEGAGALAPAVFVLLLVAQAVLAPLPAPALAFAGGYLFGTSWGFVLTWLGALLGGIFCFAISRSLGRDYVARSTRLKGLDRRVEEHGTAVVFVLRLIPVISFDVISYAAGLTGISFWRFVAATALGMAPGTFVFVYAGGSPPGPGLWAALIGLGVLAATAYVYYRRGLGRGKPCRNDARVRSEPDAAPKPEREDPWVTG